MKKLLLFRHIHTFFVLLFFGISCYSQTDANDKDPYFIETKDTVSRYGPDCITRNMLQDEKGNFWIPCWQGIIFYDGKQFTNYTLKEDLIHFHASNVFADKKGNIWFSTVRGGLYRYDGKIFTLITTKDGLADNTVSCMLEDNAGYLWFGTEKGLSRYDASLPDGKGNTFTNFTTQNGLSSNDVNSIIQDKTGKIWIAGDGGIMRYDGKSFTVFTDSAGLPFNQVTSLLQDRSGNIWIGRMEGGGLCRYNLSDTIMLAVEPFTYFMKSFIGYMYEDKKGDLWFSVNEPDSSSSASERKHKFVLYRYDGKIFQNIIQKNTPGDWQIFGITEDKKGNIWFGTMKGPCRYNARLPFGQGRSFTYFTKKLDDIKKQNRRKTQQMIVNQNTIPEMDLNGAEDKKIIQPGK